MSDAISIKLEGGEDLVRALEEVEANVKRTLKRATQAGGEVVAHVANGLAPGPHIRTAVVRSTATEAVVAIGPDAEHWYYRFMETGADPHPIRGKPVMMFDGDDGFVRTSLIEKHPGTVARPFLRSAHDETQNDARDALGAELRAEIERVRAR